MSKHSHSIRGKQQHPCPLFHLVFPLSSSTDKHFSSTLFPLYFCPCSQSSHPFNLSTTTLSSIFVISMMYMFSLPLSLHLSTCLLSIHFRLSLPPTVWIGHPLLPWRFIERCPRTKNSQKYCLSTTSVYFYLGHVPEAAADNSSLCVINLNSLTTFPVK